MCIRDSAQAERLALAIQQEYRQGRDMPTSWLGRAFKAATDQVPKVAAVKMCIRDSTGGRFNYRNKLMSQSTWVRYPFGTTAPSVSYTHLDVYKRQGLGSAAEHN